MEEYSRCSSVVCSKYYTCKRAQRTSNAEPVDYANQFDEEKLSWACGMFGYHKMYEPLTREYEVENITIPVESVINSYICNVPPTRQCAVCEELENPEANTIEVKFWLCPTCLEKLRYLLNQVPTTWLSRG